MTRSVVERTGIRLDAIPDILPSDQTPVVFRGAASHWPLVGEQSPDRFITKLRAYDAGRPFVCYRAQAGSDGRYGYTPDVKSLNFEKQSMPFDTFAQALMAFLKGDSDQSVFAPSVHLETFFPLLRSAIDALHQLPSALVQAWLGGRSLIPTHFDSQQNLACCVVGRRRFTLFPPDQIENLYIGPLDLTPAGQPISLADSVEAYPTLDQALACAWVAELEPGDVLYLPAMWWHQVEGLADINLMINYWWRSLPSHHGDAMHALFHAMLSVRDLPTPEKKAWIGLFDHYVFGNTGDGRFDHIPANAKGRLGEIDENRARQMRAQLLQALNR
ncbi:cupin-like domain-containing protein [Simiduia agarivorans]|uniref:Transcription factor jumonji jmjC domain-containing protein n=1 Tax=Simiduia agarivorans (strain DSM 21679 / JCM 13881 / BCRC 17597 / SA1) TaxID=1117647 RepID=K4KQB6_SIMAS|nr:cupin-like domain-containing protein [Simiduia agarivorans]AFV00466.2 transcription factor jumonji jmjC domain-containing protein [Simiduia agarivorans SA1 = DSM 21679]